MQRPISKTPFIGVHSSTPQYLYNQAGQPEIVTPQMRREVVFVAQANIEPHPPRSWRGREWRSTTINPSAYSDPFFFARLFYPLGFLAVIGRLLIGLAMVGRASRKSVIASERIQTVALQCARLAGLQRTVTIKRSVAESGPGVPITWGVVRPIILLPLDVGEWPEQNLRAALLHEMAHITRRDWASLILSYLACAIYWFHPFVWLAASRMRDESEQACDDFVVTSGVPAAAYAQSLIEIVRSVKRKSQFGISAISMANPPELSRRVTWLLDAGRPSGTGSRRGLVVASAVAALILLPLSALHLASQTVLDLPSLDLGPVMYERLDGQTPDWRQQSATPPPGYVSVRRGIGSIVLLLLPPVDSPG
jgi:hypothetical protein